MQLGTRWTNVSRLARAAVIDHNSGSKSSLNINTDVDSEKILRRIMIELISVKASAAATYTVRIFTRAGRVGTPGQANYSLLYEQTVTNSSVLQVFDVSIPYVDEDATANNQDSEDTPNEISASIWAEIETTTGTNVSYNLAIGFKQ